MIYQNEVSYSAKQKFYVAQHAHKIRKQKIKMQNAECRNSGVETQNKIQKKQKQKNK